MIKAIEIENSVFLWGWLLAVLLLTSCDKGAKNGSGAKEKMNVLFVVSEDNGPELGCYGNQDVSTPNIDQLAETGVRFDNAFVTYSVCSPSRSTLFTGLYPHQNGQIGLATHHYQMYDSLKTLPGYLHDVGYRTGIIGKRHVNPATSFKWDYGAIKGANFEKVQLEKYAESALEFIQMDAGKPFFLMVNFPDAHFPLQKQVDGLPPQPLDADDVTGTLPFIGVDSRRLREYTANYYNSMARLDIAVGLLLKKLEEEKLLENTVVIYMGDHGPQFSRAKCSNYEAGLRVPLIIRYPPRNPHVGMRKELVSSIDIVPTIMDITGAKCPDSLDGRSLLPLLGQGSEGKWREYVFAGGAGATSLFFYPRRSVRNDRYKLIHNLLYTRENPKYSFYADHLNGHFDGGTEEGELMQGTDEVRAAYATWKNPPEYELYDLQEDPYEFRNLIGNPQYVSIKGEMIGALVKWQQETDDPFYDKGILDRFVAEVDSVNRHFPNHSYAKDSTFRWKYLQYFK
ncbi:sulfatase family protein [Echinicola rosea]|uniref:Sulfatase n=1 Tax=Echinicola rosea TaxID=1807691 RepID=A0ABQ1UT43_9BACT|nr:sulfatase [Echinicola rosea]GGF24529.1 sulfatase [Echinicola rosea]